MSLTNSDRAVPTLCNCHRCNLPCRGQLKWRVGPTEVRKDKDFASDIRLRLAAWEQTPEFENHDRPVCEDCYRENPEAEYTTVFNLEGGKAA